MRLSRLELPAGVRGFLLWFVALFLLSQVPLYAVRYVDIVDFPNHLARLHVLEHVGDTPILRRFYRPQPGIAPNLALDSIVPLLGKMFGLETGLKLFASLCVLMAASGTAALAAALTGRLTWVALGGLLFAHNAFFQLGLFNFVFGVGAALWLLAAWIALDGSRRPRLVPAFALGATLVYLCHLAAFGVYAVCVLGYLAVRPPGEHGVRKFARRAALAGTQFLPALYLHLVTFQPGTNPAAPYPDTSASALLAYKAVLLLLIPKVSLHSAALPAGIVLAFVVFCLTVGWRHRDLSMARPAKPVLILLAIAVLLVPPLGLGSNMVDLRLALPLTLVFWASLDLTPAGQRRAPWLPWAIGAGVAITSGATLLNWAESAPLQRDLRAAMTHIEPGSRVAVVAVAEGRDGPGLTPHAVAWSVIDRSVFLSAFYIRPFQPFPVAFRLEFVPLASRARLDNAGPAPPLDFLRGYFDYVVAFGPEVATAEWAGEAVTLYASRVSRLIRP